MFDDFELIEYLFCIRDEKYASFHAGLVPNISPETIIGVRMPLLRAAAKDLVSRGLSEEYLLSLPHSYYEENQIHSLIISGEKDFDKAVIETGSFLPFIDNWATCDSLSPRAFIKHHNELRTLIFDWLRSEHVYTVRFAVSMMMRHFLGEDYSPEYPEAAAAIHRDEYYINMMVAWYFCTGLTKRYFDFLPFIEGRKLDPWTHNKAVQKCMESQAIPEERKIYLKTLKK